MYFVAKCCWSLEDYKPDVLIELLNLERKAKVAGNTQGRDRQIDRPTDRLHHCNWHSTASLTYRTPKTPKRPRLCSDREQLLTAGFYGNNRTGKTLEPRWRRLSVVIIWGQLVVRARRRWVCWSLVETHDAEVIRGVTWRRRPVVGVKAASNAVGQRHPVWSDRAVLDDVIIRRTIRSRHRPRDVKTVADGSYG